jgi:hypothetical protein
LVRVQPGELKNSLETAGSLFSHLATVQARVQAVLSSRAIGPHQIQAASSSSGPRRSGAGRRERWPQRGHFGTSSFGCSSKATSPPPPRWPGKWARSRSSNAYYAADRARRCCAGGSCRRGRVRVATTRFDARDRARRKPRQPDGRGRSVVGSSLLPRPASAPRAARREHHLASPCERFCQRLRRRNGAATS